MKRLSFFSAALATTALAFAGTPTMDGTFDGTSTWGNAVAEDSTSPAQPGWQGFDATALYVTSDATYAYFGASLANLGGDWQTFGFAISTTSGGGNVGDVWGRQFTYNFTEAPEFVVRGNLPGSGGWTELRTWNGSNFDTGGGTNYAETAGNVGLSGTFVEVRIPRATLGSKTANVTFFLSGNNTTHGLFDAVPHNADFADQWDENPVNVLSTQTPPTTVPVTVSSFTID